MSSHSQHPLLRLMAQPFMRALLALIFVLALGAIFHAEGAFFQWGAHRDMLRQVAVFGMLACGMTIVILSGGIDLSVGSVLGLVAVLFSLLTIHYQWPALPAVAVCCAAGAACGAVSGGFIARFGMQPFIVTLAMMVFARGLAKHISGGQKISGYVQDPDGSFRVLEMPAIFGILDARILGGHVATVTLIFLLCLLVAGVLLARTRLGRHLYAVGGNETAARLSGVPVGRTKLVAYALSGFFAAVAGICQAAQEYQGDPEAGVSYELTAIAIVVIGGTNLMGGRGGMLLTLLGALTIGYLEKILSLNAVGESSRLMLTGGIIVAAVAFQRMRGQG